MSDAYSGHHGFRLKPQLGKAHHVEDRCPGIRIKSHHHDKRRDQDAPSIYRLYEKSKVSFKQSVIGFNGAAAACSKNAESFIASMADFNDKGFLCFVVIVTFLLYLSFNDVLKVSYANYLEDASLEAQLEWAFLY